MTEPTYKNDHSFFTYVKPPACYIGMKEIITWFKSNPVSMYRFIIDEELDQRFADLKERNELYPGIRTIAVTINPWARAVVAYNDLQRIDHPYREYAQGSFTEFLNNLVKHQFMKQQVTWFEYADQSDNLVSPTYCFKTENIDEDFKVIQNYFEIDKPLKKVHEIPQYQNLYTTETKKIISELFPDDIERYGYEF